MYWTFVDCIVVMLPVVKLPCHNTTLNAVPEEDILDSAVPSVFKVVHWLVGLVHAVLYQRRM